jgi:hypothetical protein
MGRLYFKTGAMAQQAIHRLAEEKLLLQEAVLFSSKGPASLSR